MIAWLREWWWVIGLIALGVGVAIATKGKVLPDLDEIKKTAKAQANAKKLQAKLGRDAALKVIKEEYAETINELDETQKQEAEKLKDDPGARARFYSRVAVKRSREKAS